MDFRILINERRAGVEHQPFAMEFLAFQAGLPADDPLRTVPDYQLAAWLMAAVFQPPSLANTAQLTLALAESGERLDLTSIPKPWVDKHSTGGVGDKTTLILLPMLASLGVTMVKMSGRGLGITGGTIDKLESIPGFRTDLTPKEMLDQASRIGIALSGQTPRLAPADKTLYALRDATATVDSIPLIASSVLSKKIAAGAEHIMIDLKCGSGSFMKDRDQARELAQTMLEIGKQCRINLRIAISDMNQPLGHAIGNALEVEEAIAVLRGLGDPRLTDFCVELCAATLVQCEKAANPEEAAQLARSSIDEGKALAKMREWVTAQGGSPMIFDEPQWFQPHRIEPVLFEGPNAFITGIRADRIGQLAVDMGAGRSVVGGSIDPAVGIALNRAVGDPVRRGDTLCYLYLSETSVPMVSERAHLCFQFGEEPQPRTPVILEWVR